MYTGYICFTVLPECSLKGIYTSYTNPPQTFMVFIYKCVPLEYNILVEVYYIDLNCSEKGCSIWYENFRRKSHF